jgi:hypothetical protein
MKEKLLATKVYTMTYEETLDLVNLIMTNVTLDVKTALEFIAAGHRVPYLKPGDYVKIKLAPEDLNDLELMEDYGLYKDGYQFGKVVKSANYGSDHIHTYLQVKVDLFLDGVRNTKHFNIFEVEKIQLEEIPFYNGTYIKSIAGERIIRMDSKEEQ